MINIALIRNPIQPDRRKEHNTEFAGQSLQTLIAPILADWPDTEFVVSVNGGIIEKDDVVSFYPADGDYVILMPQMGKGFGDILRTMLMVALMIWAPALGAQWATAGGIVNTTMAGIYTGMITMAGGLILNAILPPSAQDSSTETSTSYGWQGSGITEIPGTPVGRTYGTVSPTLVRLQRHITTDGENQYLNVLYSAGGGPVGSLQDITIGGNPIANYDDVEYWIRLGTNDQDVIENFSDTYSDYSLSYELDDDSEWHTQRTEGTGVEGLEIMLVLPGGLFYTTNKGSLATATVKIDAQYKLASSETWIDWLTTETISDKKSEAIFKSYRKDKLIAGQYDVRTRCTYKSGTTTRYSTRIAWSQLSEIMYDDFVYPNKVLLGIRIKATDQLSGGDPEVKCTVTRSTVWVWDPYTAAYVQKRASNPYWAAYDLLHKCELLKNIQTGANEYSVDGFPARRFDYDKYAEYGAYADELVDGDYRFVLNLFVEGNIKMMDALNRISSVGRGVILPRGTKFSCLCDMPTSMTHIFTDGNITNGTMQGEWQSVENRSRSVEVSFWNKEKNYTKDMAIYLSDEYNEDGMVPNPTQVTYYGITDYAHAYREAAFLARCNKYKERTKSWQADIDAIPCVIGDVVGVQTQTSNWGSGGRIVSATLNTVTLDQEVTLAAGTIYKIYVRLEDDTLVQKTVATVSVNTSTRVLTVTEAFASIPKQFDLYALGTAIAKMKVLSIVRADDQKAKITAEQYFEEIYSDTVTVPDIQYSDFTVKALTVTAAEVLPRPGLSTQNVLVTWNGPRDPRASITKIFANGVLKDTDFGNTFGSKKIQLSVDPAYSIRIDVTDSLGNLVATGKTSHASSYAVPHVTGLAVAQAYRETGSTLSYELSVSWTPPSPEIYAAADVYLRSNLATAEEIGELDDAGMAVAIDRLGLDVAPWKQIGSGYDKFTFPGAVKGAIYKFMVVARDTNGVSADESTAPTVEYTVAVKPYTPIMPSGLTLSVSDKPYCAWAANTDTDVDFYELRTDNNPGVTVGQLYRGSSIQCNPVLTSRIGTLYLFAHNPSGHYSPALIYGYNFPAPAAPTVTITDVFQGFVVATNALPTGALGISVHIDTAIYTSTNNTYKFSASAGIYDVAVAFYDYFGEGTLSAVQEKIILIYIDPAWIDAETLSKAMMDADVKTALQAAIDAAPMSTVTAMQGALTTAQGDITTAEAAIIAAQGRLTTVEGTVTTQGASITTLESGITLKADKTTLSAVDGRLITAEGSIVTQAGQIALKAAQTTVDTLTGRVTSAEGSITTIAGQVALKAAQTTVDTLTGRVTTAEGTLVTQAGQIALKAAQTSVDTLADRVTSAESSITANASAIALRVTQTSFNTLSGTVTGHTSAITQNATNISSIVTELGKPLAQCTYTAITQALTAINLRATKANLISEINVCPEAVTINGQFLHITATTLIDNNVIVTGMIQAGAVTAAKMSVTSLSAISANIGTLRTATTGARTEISDNIIRVYDASNVLRVRMGVW